MLQNLNIDWSDEEPKSPSDRSTNGDEESGPSKSGSKQMKQMSEKRRRFGSDDDSESESDISSCDSDDDDDVSSSSKSIPELVLTAKDGNATSYFIFALIFLFKYFLLADTYF